MKIRISIHFPASLTVFSLVCTLAICSGVLAAQDTVSVGPLPLYAVKTVYITSTSDFVQLLKSRFETWGVMTVTERIEEADAVLTCETESRIVPAKVVVRRVEARVRLVDRHTQNVIWSTTKTTSWDNALADEIVAQLKKDREKSSIP